MKQVSLEDLERRHRSLDSEVNRLERQVYLTSLEQTQVAALKKEKLRTRDLIQDLLRSRAPAWGAVSCQPSVARASGLAPLERGSSGIECLLRS